MYGRRGETQAARSAASAGVPFCLSTVGICSLEEVARTGAAPWFQLYVLKDRGYMRELLRRAKVAGCPVLVLTVDLPAPGARYRDIRSGFRGLTGWRALLNQVRDGDVEDAREVVRVGAQGVVVSNHGGRQLDGVRSSISVLPAIADAVGGDLEVYLDSGVRSGLDVLKALSLGAKACFVGRAWAFALAAGGQPAITSMLERMRAELEAAMILTGCTSTRHVPRHYC
jgi:isopentenyl diphosphate isomerase/L-lactate dehydrogenase-like FMN-dependent dehydrogenase